MPSLYTGGRAGSKFGNGVFTLERLKHAKGEEIKNIKIDKVSDEEMREFNREMVATL